MARPGNGDPNAEGECVPHGGEGAAIASDPLFNPPPGKLHVLGFDSFDWDDDPRGAYHLIAVCDTAEEARRILDDYRSVDDFDGAHARIVGPRGRDR